MGTENSGAFLVLFPLLFGLLALGSVGAFVWFARSRARQDPSRPPARANSLAIVTGVLVLVALGVVMVRPFLGLFPVDIRRPPRDYFPPILYLALYGALVVGFVSFLRHGVRGLIGSNPTQTIAVALGVVAVAAMLARLALGFGYIQVEEAKTVGNVLLGIGLICGVTAFALSIASGTRPQSNRNASNWQARPPVSAWPGFWLLLAAWASGGLAAGAIGIGYDLAIRAPGKEYVLKSNDWSELFVLLLLGIPPLAVATAGRWVWVHWWRPADPVRYAPAVLLPDAPSVAPGSKRLNTCPKCGRTLDANAPEGLCPHCLLQGALPSAQRPSPTVAFVEGFAAPPVDEIAGLFPHLEVKSLIGQGGMGAVYLARQKALDRLVALKLVRPHGDDPTFAERFAREARAMARLNHSQVVTVYESGTAGGLPYLVMEYVDGVTLRDAMRGRKLAPAEALAVVPQICEALAYAHAQGVVHRDVKPENILLTRDGRVKIADFGLAKVTDSGGVSLTGTRQAMGTPHYMAPEQWEKPGEVDHRADIYALGVVFYELLTGELPLGRFDPPSHKVEIDVRLDGVVLRALAKEPERRYQHASDVKTDLEEIRSNPGLGRYPDVITRTRRGRLQPNDGCVHKLQGSKG